MKPVFGDIRVRKSIQRIMLMLILLVSFIAGSVPAARAQSPDLFGNANAADAAPGADSAPATRLRYVNVNLGLLLDGNGQARDVSAVPEVGLNLFPDASYTGVVTKQTDYGADTHAWSGVLKDVTGGYFYLVATGQTLVAHVASAKGIYEVSKAGDSVYRVIQVDQSKFVDEPNEGRDMPAGDVPPVRADLRATDSAAQIDVMVVYTGAALTAEGSLAALKARIALAIVETNQGYANAGITTSLRLVHIQKIAYAQSGDIQKDVNRLANPTDGYMDDVQALRNKYGADMVSLIVDYGGAYRYCGIAKKIMATAGSAFDVVARICMTGYYSFGHEFGHLQGARHDYPTDTSMTPFSYGHGYVHIAGTELESWRTIMAYNDECDKVDFYCQRLQYWSNPGITYGGQPMGDADLARNYQVLNDTAFTVANFRSQKIGSDFSSDFVSDAADWSPASGTWALSSGDFYSSTGLSGRAATAKHSSKYGDLSYSVTMFRTGTCTKCANRIIIRGNSARLDPTKWWEPSYVFQYTNNGNFSVFYMDALGGVSALKGWTFSSAIVPGGWNTLQVVAVGSSLTFYINGVPVWARKNASLVTGQVGFGFYRNSAAGTLYVDSASLTNAPTADINPAADVLSGLTVQGGDINHAP